MSDNRGLSGSAWRKAKFTALCLMASAATLGISACSKSNKPDCSSPEVFCVGVVTDVGKVDDKSFNQSSWEGVQKAKKELGAVTQYIETTDPKDYSKNIATFAEEKYDVVVTVGFALGETTRAAAAQFPDTKFIGVDQFQPPGAEKKNLAGLVFPEDHAGYLVGALAALTSKTGKIGAVLATDAVPPVWRYGEGFKVGAKAAKPTIDLTVVYHNDVGIDKTFSDPEWGKTTALSMIDKGVDVVFGGGGKTGNGALIGAASKNVYGIGVDTDQYFTVPEAQKSLLSSAMKLLDEGVFDLLKQAKEGKFPSGNSVGKAGNAPYHDLAAQVPDDVKSKIEEMKKGLQSGSIKTNVAPTKP
ncbi:BMP family ABC transporter substrate-binding protein [Pendulispora rubella]|uniref:BMP family ABC transporter substrate-binding protein n=1 Tax=Pendulispora rubella TaxID=2741070 RepID=A0ABZ2L3G8_9BACT